MSSPIQRKKFEITTDASGDWVDATDKFFGWYLDWIHVTLPDSDALETTAVLKLEDDDSGIEIYSDTGLTAGFEYIRFPATSAAGARQTTGFTEVFKTEGKLNFSIASGGNAKSATIIVQRSAVESRRDKW